MSQLEKIASHVPGVVYQYRLWPDGSSAFPYASAGMQSIYGVSSQDVRNDASPVFEVIHPDDLEEVSRSINESAAQLTDWHCQYRILHPERGCIWVEGEASPEALDDGSVVWHGYIRDISERKLLELAREEESLRFESFVASTPVAMAMFDREMRCLAASESWGQLLGVGVADQLGKDHYEVFPDLPEAWRAAHRRGLAGETVEDPKSRWDRADGSYLWFQWLLKPWGMSDESTSGIIISGRDITHEVEIEDRLGHDRQEMAALLENTRVAHIALDPDLRIRRVNQAAEFLWGLDRASLIGREFWDVIPEVALSLHDAVAEAMAMGKFRELEIFVSELEKHLQVRLVPWTQGLWVLFQDITERKEAEARMQLLATTDQLTGALNRASFEGRLDAELIRFDRYRVPFSLVMFDIDHFKRVNDSFGHARGDAVLRSVVSRVRSILRGPDSLCRWGGEEFIILLPATNLAGALVIAERCLSIVAQQEFEEAGRVTISLGVAQHSAGHSVDELLRRVDENLYAAKRAGRNCIDAGRVAAQS
ncbi:MAG: diguanylate cyclase [Halieaceae bacterium]|nr:diguanylate cyclase [Halieaceae bacterium]